MDRTVPAPAARLLDFIGAIEAPDGYGVIFANRQDRLAKPLTAMTLDEVLAGQKGWSRWSKPASSAAGRYQFMRATLTDLKVELKLRGGQIFDANLQDRLGYHLLKRRGYDAFVDGRLSVTAFGLALAKEWASLPVLAATEGAHGRLKRGQSYYAGDGVNKDLTKPAAFEAALRRALDLARASTASPSRASGKPEPADDGASDAAEEPEDALQAPAKPSRPPPPVSKPWWLPVALWRRLMPATPAVPAEEIRGDPVVFRLQRQLADMGYGEVGLVDGAYGTKTRNALKLFRDEQARELVIPFEPPIAADIIAAVAAGRPRELPDERRNATAQTLRDAGSTPVQQIDGFRPVAWILGSLGIGGAAKDSGLLDGLRNSADSALETMQGVQQLVLFLLGAINWLVQHWYLLALGLGIYVGWRVFRAIVEVVGLFRQNILGRAGA